MVTAVSYRTTRLLRRLIISPTTSLESVVHFALSPAMAAGVTDRLWSVEDLVALWESLRTAKGGKSGVNEAGTASSKRTGCICGHCLLWFRGCLPLHARSPAFPFRLRCVRKPFLSAVYFLPARCLFSCPKTRVAHYLDSSLLARSPTGDVGARCLWVAAWL